MDMFLIDMYSNYQQSVIFVFNFRLFIQVSNKANY